MKVDTCFNLKNSFLFKNNCTFVYLRCFHGKNQKFFISYSLSLYCGWLCMTLKAKLHVLAWTDFNSLVLPIQLSRGVSIPPCSKQKIDRKSSQQKMLSIRLTSWIRLVKTSEQIQKGGWDYLPKNGKDRREFCFSSCLEVFFNFIFQPKYLVSVSTWPQISNIQSESAHLRVV